jgi:hypothetical protein
MKHLLNGVAIAAVLAARHADFGANCSASAPATSWRLPQKIRGGNVGSIPMANAIAD